MEFQNIQLETITEIVRIKMITEANASPSGTKFKTTDIIKK